MQKLIKLIDQNPLIHQLRERYDLLSRKDQNALLALALFMTLAIGYLIVWEPLSQWSGDQKQDYTRQLNASNWIEAHIQEVKEQSRKKSAGSAHRDLSTVVAGVARQTGIVISRIQPDKKGISVWLEDAAYQKALAWLVILETKFQVSIQQIKVDRLKEEGRIKVYTRLNNS